LYESRGTRPVSRAAFLRRVGGHFALATLVVLGSLAAGMWGYEHYEHLAWRDAFLNAAMLLGGMGPVNAPVTPGGKLFAGWYALYAGPVFLVAVGFMAAPVMHRLLHQFHWEADNPEGE
jgi:hypothetical protein